MKFQFELAPLNPIPHSLRCAQAVRAVGAVCEHTFSMFIDFSAFTEDSRGNPLERYEFVEMAPEADRLYLRGPAAAAQQVRWIVGKDEIAKRRLDQHERSDWTHCYEIERSAYESLVPTLDLLQTVVLVPCRPPLYSTVALGYYMDPDSHSDSQQWSRTEAGELNYQAKYCQSETAINELVTRLANVARTHHLYSAFGDCVVSVPGHDSNETSLSEQLAARLATALSKPWAKVSNRSESRLEAKSSSSADLDLSHEFVLRDAPPEMRVPIVVDDVLRSGETMRSVAAVLSDAGAKAVLGLAGVRTMRSSR
ncbi:MAG: hypothetical protein HZB14_06585 [Actinobacteria bacterium]|nr:hypothetical protein [Actinomycetota bacterium]